MTTTEADIVALERDIVARIADAADESALEGERALGHPARCIALVLGEQRPREA